MRYRRLEHIAWRKVGDETILLNLETRQMYALNETAGYIWHVLDSLKDIAELGESLAVDEAKATLGSEGVEVFCSQLVEEGLSRMAGEEDRPVEAPVAPAAPDHVEPPRILWQEKLQVMGGSCAHQPGTSVLCEQAPFGVST